MNKLSIERRCQIVSALVEGNSIRSICRMTGTAKRTVTRLLVELGAACRDYQDHAFRNLTCRRIQCDEIWSFIGCKQKHVKPGMAGTLGRGDAWVWIAIDADTKLVPCWFVGKRDPESANVFIADLASRLSHRVQLTSDGHKVYLSAVLDAFGEDIDYAMLVKMYSADAPSASRYSPPICVAARETAIFGSPDPAHISTSFIERQNLTMRMSMRRFTRLTNGYSKKLENHEAAIAVNYMYYNFARIHQSLRVTPAMEAGISQHVWSIAEIVMLADAQPMRLAA
jgi:IS1 family transposase